MINFLTSILSEGFSFWKNERKAKHEMKLAGLRNRQRLLENEQSNNHEWEMKALETSSKSLKWLSFMLFASPVMVTVIAPEHGGEIFKNLEIIPQGFMQIYYGITGAIWGLASLKDHGINFKSLFRHVNNANNDQ